MLIARADIGRGAPASIRIADGRIAAVDAALAPRVGEDVFDARGAAVLPGLHDHHIHLLAFAAALDSVPCGPPQHRSADTLRAALRRAAAERNGGWLHGIGYHESVAGEIDRDWIDSIVDTVPVRIQHRSGRLWILNSQALARIGAGDGSHTPLERRAGRLTGRLYHADAWLRERIGGELPNLRRASDALARRGVTAVTDAGADNGRREFAHFAAQQACGDLRQDVLMMGSAALSGADSSAALRIGATKLYLREASLPGFDDFCVRIRRSHENGRAVAIHCVTLAELIFAIEAVRACGVDAGDRIEHASLCTPQALALLAALGLRVVTQPHFVFERGDAYLAELSADEVGGLYRARSFVDAGVALAAGSDAPYGNPDPWLAMAAAVRRRTRGGTAIGAGEALLPQQALRLFLGDPLRPGEGAQAIATGMRADLCVLDRGFAAIAADFAAVEVRMTLRRGEPTWIA